MQKNQDNLFKFRKRVIAQSFLHALMYGIIIGLGAAFIAAFITWFLPINGLWLSLGLLLGGIAAATPLFYFLRFRPDIGEVARKVDRSLGLKERTVTMIEYGGESGYLAECQRRDAGARLSEGNTRSLKFRLSALCIVLLAVFGFFGAAMTTVTALSAYDILPSGGRVVDSLTPDRVVEYAIEYIVEDEAQGVIIGEAVQVVPDGESTEKVTAEANEGYEFVGWDDGFENPTRTDIVQGGDMLYIAIFAEISDDEDEGDDGDSDEDEPGDSSGDDSGTGDTGTPSEDNGASNIIDGDTYYKLDYDTYYQMAMQYLAEHPDIPDYLREIIEAYFNILA